jgi:hypothetical protein
MLHIFPVVEGHGEEVAVPVLLRNFFGSRHAIYDVNIYRPYRLPRGKMTKADQWDGILTLAIRRIEDGMSEGDRGLVLVLCDSDDDCPISVRESIESQIRITSSRVDFQVVVAQKEFEAWFLTCRASFEGHHECVQPIPQIDDIPLIRDAKGYFERSILKPGRYYSEVVDQPKFSALINFKVDSENNDRSLRRFTEVLSRAVGA